MITDINLLDVNKQYSYTDYLTWQFEERVELIRGWIWKTSPAPLRKHQQVFGVLFSEIYNHLKGKPCAVYAAPFDVRLMDKRKSREDNQIVSVVQPDISVICDAGKLDERGCLGAPDWVVEILSPGNSKREMKAKYSLYEENGVREYWVVSTAQLYVQVFDLIDEKFVYRATYHNDDQMPVGIFPGFAIDGGNLFEGME